MNISITKLLIIFLVIGLAFSALSMPVAADNPNEDLLCGEAEGSDSAANSIQTIFLILSALGPVFGTLFYVGMSVVESASIDKDYSDKKRKVIIAGFSVPIAIALGNAVAGALIGMDVSCFFPEI